MNPFKEYTKGMLKKLVIFTLVIMTLLVLIGYSRFVSGWLAGSAINLLYFIMLSRRSEKAIKMPPDKAATFMKVGAFLRLLTIFLALILIIQFPSINLAAAVAGILSFRFMIYGESLIKYFYKKD